MKETDLSRVHPGQDVDVGVIGGMKVKAGMITLPETPGLGLDVDPAFLKKMAKV
jgi:L-alanine-DL-glutamate epimerase-like enolase superfamily enzyme